MINHSDYSCDKCAREISRHCRHCLHTAEKPPTRFKPKKKTGCETPELRKPTPPPMPPVKPPKEKENTTMYGLKLYIPFEDLDAYIHDHIEEAHKDHIFIPVKAEINELDLGIEISLVSAVPNEFYGRRYKLDLNTLPNEKPPRGLRARSNIYDEVMSPCINCAENDKVFNLCAECGGTPDYKLFKAKESENVF